jgi:hypothetical protein
MMRVPRLGDSKRQVTCLGGPTAHVPAQQLLLSLLSPTAVVQVLCQYRFTFFLSATAIVIEEDKYRRLLDADQLMLS